MHPPHKALLPPFPHSNITTSIIAKAPTDNLTLALDEAWGGVRETVGLAEGGFRDFEIDGEIVSEAE